MNEYNGITKTSKPFMNPYLAGTLLGLTLLLAYITLGAGLGASGGIARIGAFLLRLIAPEHVDASPYFSAWGKEPLRYYLVFMLGGTFLGGLLSATQAKRFHFQIERGVKFSPLLRLGFAFTGGILVGYASRLAQGCTSGQALTGGAMLLSGSLLFLGCLFAGGYATAWFVRRQWHD